MSYPFAYTVAYQQNTGKSLMRHIASITTHEHDPHTATAPLPVAN